MVSQLKDKIYTLSLRYGKRTGLDLPYFVKNGFWLTLQQAIGALSGLLLAMAFARFVDKDIFGQYQLAISIILTLSIITIPGLNIAMSQSVARGNEGDYPAATKKSFFWGLLGAPILLAVGFYYYSYQQNHELGAVLMIVAWIFPFLFASNTWNGFYLGKHMFKKIAKLYSLQSFLAAAFIAASIFIFRNNLMFLVLAYCVTYAVLNCIYYLKSLKDVSNSRIDPETTRYGYFLTLTDTLESLSENFDQILIGALLSPQALAVFVIVSYVPLRFRNTARPFFSIVFPKLTSDRITFSDILKNNRKMIAALFLVISIGTAAYFFLIKYIDYLFFGANYADAYSYSLYFIFFVFLTFPLLFIGRYFQAKKNRKALFASGPVFIIMKSLLIVAGIHWYGLPGAIIAFNIAIAVKFVISIIFIRR